MIGPSPSGEGTHHNDMKVMDLQTQIGRGEYQVDPQAVAEAIVRRLLSQWARRPSRDRRSA